MVGSCRHILSVDPVERFLRNRTILIFILWDQHRKVFHLKLCLFNSNSKKSFASVAQTETFFI